MAHFAEIDPNGYVLRVIVIDDSAAPDPAPHNSEPLGQAFIADVLKLTGEWKQTSYSNSFRSKYAGIGDRYDRDLDVFVAPTHSQQFQEG